jgi:hypothetical protein
VAGDPVTGGGIGENEKVGGSSSPRQAAPSTESSRIVITVNLVRIARVTFLVCWPHCSGLDPDPSALGAAASGPGSRG